MRTPENADTSLMLPIELGSGTTSNYDYSLQYHGYLSERRNTHNGEKEFRADYWAGILGESIRLPDEEYSSLRRLTETSQ